MQSFRINRKRLNAKCKIKLKDYTKSFCTCVRMRQMKKITSLVFPLSLSHFCFYFTPKCVNYIFFSASSSHLHAAPLSVLSAAAGRGRMEMCVFLLERGAGLEIPNRRGMVPLLSATKHGHTQVKEGSTSTRCSSSGFAFIFMNNFHPFPRLQSCCWSKVQTPTSATSRGALR